MQGVGLSRRVELFTVPVDTLRLSESLDLAWALFGTAPPGRPCLVLTPNPELVMQAQRDPELLAAARAADVALADGVGVVWALRRQGVRVPERVTGVDFMLRLLGLAAQHGTPVYLLGARPHVVAAAARRAVERFPGLQLVGAADGYFAARGEEPEALRRVAASGAQLLLLGMGAPDQLRFLYRHRAEFGAVRLAMGVGGSLDVLSGLTARAPAGIRRLGLEWFWRLVHEPRRWRRQLALPRFAFAVLRAGRSAVRPGTRAVQVGGAGALDGATPGP